MKIEVHINGVLRKAWEIPEDSLQDIDGATWEENVEARQAIIDRYLRQFKSFVMPLFDGQPVVTFCLSTASKGNDRSIERLEYFTRRETNKIL